MTDIVQRTLQRLDELIALGRGPAQTDRASLQRFVTSSTNLLARFVGEETAHYKAFRALEDYIDPTLDLEEQTEYVHQIVGILQAARDDIAGGFMFTRDLVISAANFGDILEQAEHLLESGYKDAAAVLVGAVLESSLRKLCDKRGVSYSQKDTMEPLNVRLVKDGAYQTMTQKMITTWGDLRNNAAHGHFDRYTDGDVRQMAQWVSGFMEQELR